MSNRALLLATHRTEGESRESWPEIVEALVGAAAEHLIVGQRIPGDRMRSIRWASTVVTLAVTLLLTGPVPASESPEQDSNEEEGSLTMGILRMSVFSLAVAGLSSRNDGDGAIAIGGLYLSMSLISAFLMDGRKHPGRFHHVQWDLCHAPAA